MTAVSEPRVLVLAREPDIYAMPIRARYPGLAVETCSSYEALGAVVHGFEPTVVLAGKIGAPFPQELLLDTAPSIEWVQCDSAGVDHLRPFSSQVRVTSASGIHDEALADYVVCAMLMFNLHFPTFFRQQRDHVWEPKPLRPSTGSCRRSIQRRWLTPPFDADSISLLRPTPRDQVVQRVHPSCQRCPS